MSMVVDMSRRLPACLGTKGTIIMRKSATKQYADKVIIEDQISTNVNKYIIQQTATHLYHPTEKGQQK
jgi:hypothetical protein